MMRFKNKGLIQSNGVISITIDNICTLVNFVEQP